MRLPFILIALAVCLGLGVVIAWRLSDEAVMMLAGVSCGIVASIPVSLGLLIALTRERAPDCAEPSVPQETAGAGSTTTALTLADTRVRQYIVSTGTAPRGGQYRIWGKDNYVFWQRTDQPNQQIYYVHQNQIFA